MKNLKWIVIVLVAAVGLWKALPTKEANATEVAVAPAHHAHHHAPLVEEKSAAVAAAPTSVSRAPAAATSASLKDIASLNEMAETVSEATVGHMNLKSLVERLQKSGQQPRVIRDANPDSGEMIVVRADAPLEGTRYFHAQYFVGDDGLPFVQHMSFEFKPGPNAMSDALAAVAKNFPGLSAPTHQREGYSRWKLDENRILWVKELNRDDVAHDPFNAYSPKDIGAVRVAVEQEIHD